MGREIITKSAVFLNDELLFEDVNILEELETNVAFQESDEENEVKSSLMEFMIEQRKIIAKQHEESIMQKIQQEFERMTKMIQSKVNEAIGQITTVTATQQEVLSDMSSSTMTAC